MINSGLDAGFPLLVGGRKGCLPSSDLLFSKYVINMFFSASPLICAGSKLNLEMLSKKPFLFRKFRNMYSFDYKVHDGTSPEFI